MILADVSYAERDAGKKVSFFLKGHVGAECAQRLFSGSKCFGLFGLSGLSGLSGLFGLFRWSRLFRWFQKKEKSSFISCSL